MKKFVFVYYGGKKREEVDEDVMNKWKAWFGSMGDKLVDGGNPFNDDGQSVTADGTEAIPADMWPAKGFSVVNAADMSEATSLAGGCPLLEEGDGASVRVYEALPM